MHVDEACIEALVGLQDIDKQILKAKRLRTELPQRAKMVALQKKRAEFESKKAQVDAIRAKADAEMEKVESEDSDIAEKQAKVQELISNAGTDFRSVEAHSKEMSGFAKRRDTLGTRIEELSVELEKIKGIQGKIEAGLAKISADEDAIKSDFLEQDGLLARQIAELGQKREEIGATLPSDVFARYEKTLLKTNGVALGMLEDGRCGVCRSDIEHGRLIELKAHAPLGTCPNCGRILIVR